MVNEYATLFTGGDGFGVGAGQAGLKPSWGVEIDPAIAAWAEQNNPNLTVIRSDVSDVDYTALPSPYWLHASPVCKRASIASRNDEEMADHEQGEAVCRAIQGLNPPVFSLENVWGYRDFEAFKMILKCLDEGGYNFRLAPQRRGLWCTAKPQASYFSG